MCPPHPRPVLLKLKATDSTLTALNKTTTKHVNDAVQSFKGLSLWGATSFQRSRAGPMVSARGACPAARPAAVLPSIRQESLDSLSGRAARLLPPRPVFASRREAGLPQFTPALGPGSSMGSTSVTGAKLRVAGTSGARQAPGPPVRASPLESGLVGAVGPHSPETARAWGRPSRGLQTPSRRHLEKGRG